MSVNDYNSNFIKNNPQYGVMGGSKPVAPSIGQSSYLPNGTTVQPKGPGTAVASGNVTPVGLKAASPQDKIKPPSNSLPSNQKSTPSTGYIGSPSSLNTSSFPGIVGTLASTAANGTPEVQAATDEIERYNKSYANANAGIGLSGTDFNYAQGTEQNVSNQYQQGLAARQTALSNALTSQGQRIGGLQSAGSLTNPTQVSPGNFYVSPLTGKDVSGGEINPFTGGIRSQQVALGGQYATNNAVLGGARNIANQFLEAVSKNPDFNSGSLNFGNAIDQLLQNNLSNDRYPGIQSSFNNLIAQYSNILGGKDAVLNIIRTARPQSMQALINSLDQQASGVQTGILSAGTTGTPGATLNTNPLSVIQPQTGGSQYNGIALPH